MVHGIIAARLDAVPQAIECADSPPQLLAVFSGPQDPMNNGDTSKFCTTNTLSASDSTALTAPRRVKPMASE